MANRLQGISVSLPLLLDSSDGPYRLNKNLGQVVKQLRRFLFEGITSGVKEKIATAIQEQVDEYMPFVELQQIQFLTNENNNKIGFNELRISIEYGVSSINLSDTLEFTEEITN